MNNLTGGGGGKMKLNRPRRKKDKRDKGRLSNGAIRRAIVMMVLCDLVADRMLGSDERLSGAAGEYVDFMYKHLRKDTQHELHKGSGALESIKPTNIFLVWGILKIAELAESQDEWFMYKDVQNAAQIHAESWLPMPPPEDKMKIFMNGIFGIVPDGSARHTP